MSAHQHLRRTTRTAHDRVDAGFARYDLADAHDYGAFLQRHAAAFVPAEAALTSAGAGHLISGWAELCRAQALLADLGDLGLSRPDPRKAPRYSGKAAILGGTYVLEGSRLGGAILRRSVGPGLPRRFLDSVQPPGRWRSFIALLDDELYDPDQLSLATKAALETFALFEIAETRPVK